MTRNRVSFRWVLRSLFLAALAIVLACGQEQPSSEDSPEQAGHDESEVPTIHLDAAALDYAKVTVAPVEERELGYRVETTGEIAFNEKHVAHVISRVDGWAEDVRVFLEEEVQRGQLLVAVYSPKLIIGETEYLQARRRADAACESSDGPDCQVAQRILTSARTKLRILGAAAGEIETLDRTRKIPSSNTIRAPIGGTVVESNVIRGNALQPGDDLFKIADLSTVWVNVDIYEKDLGKVSKGNKVEVRVPAYPNAVFRGELNLVSDVVDEEKRTVRGRTELDNLDRQLRPGMFAEVSILGGGRGDPTVVVPDESIQEIEKSKVVFVEQKEGVFEVRTVRVGKVEAGMVPVVAGLSAGERVATKGSFFIKSELLKGTFEAGHGH